jgi:hypothetical protein
MRRTSRKRKQKLLKKILRSCLFALKVGLEAEILNWTLFGTGGLLWYFFVTSGIPQNVALSLAIIIILILFIFALNTFNNKKQKLTRPKTKGEIKLAQWITQTIVNQNSTEWEEYQDWLHDILLSRQQLLDARYPRWQVSLITYKRLGEFWIIVGITKVKQVATSIWRSH